MDFQWGGLCWRESLLYVYKLRSASHIQVLELFMLQLLQCWRLTGQRFDVLWSQVQVLEQLKEKPRPERWRGTRWREADFSLIFQQHTLRLTVKR